MGNNGQRASAYTGALLKAPATVALMAFGYTAAEVASELSGGLAVASKLAKSTRFQNGKAKVKSSLTTSIWKAARTFKAGFV